MKNNNTRNKKEKRKSYFFGLFAEYYVVFLLFFKGYKLLAKRYKTKLGEVDLIFKKKNNIIAVEVKARKNREIEVSSIVSYRQFYRILNSLKIFLNKNEDYCNFNLSVDVVLVKGIFNVKHIKNVWYE